MIKRTIPKSAERDVVSLIMRLRTMAAMEPGYVSGETLRNVDDHDKYLVISTWQSADDWKSWRYSKERADIQSKIDALTGSETDYEIYQYPEKSVVRPK